MLEPTMIKNRVSIRVQTAATVGAIAGAVVLPQIFHLIGAASGLGTALGEVFLPMHLPVMLAGLLAGPVAGGISGLLGPLVSFALTGMPAAAMLPFMMIELCVYGLSAGLLRRVKLPSVCKILAVQIAGRAVRAGAILLAAEGFGYTGVAVQTIWSSIPKGLFGILLQLCLLPLILYRVEGAGKYGR